MSLHVSLCCHLVVGWLIWPASSKYTCVASLYAQVVILCYVGMGFIACMASQITSVQVTDTSLSTCTTTFCRVLLHFLSVLFSKLAVRSCLSLQCILLAPH